MSLHGLLSYLAGSKDTDSANTTPASDMAFYAQSPGNRVGRLPVIRSRPDEGQQSRHEVRKKDQPKHNDSYNRNAPYVNDSDNRDPSINDMLHRTRRQLALEVIKSKKDFRALESQTQQLSSKYKRLLAETKDLHVKIEQSHNENQTLSSKNRILTSKYEKLTTENRTLQTKYDELRATEVFYSSRYKLIKQKYIQPYAMSKKFVYREATGQTMTEVLRPFLQDALDATPLRAQVQGLGEQLKSVQEQLLSNVEKVQAVPDDQFASDFRALASSIKSLSRSIKLSDAVDIMSIGEIKDCCLVRGVRPAHWSTRPRQMCMIEAFVWSVIYTEVFDSPFYMFGKVVDSVSNGFFDLFGRDHSHRWPIPSELAERWRYTTTEKFVEIVGREASTQGLAKNKNGELDRSIQEVRTKVAFRIEKPLARIASKLDFAQVTTIVDEAFALAIKMSLERCRIQIVFPSIKTPFTVGQPDLVSTYESENVQNGRVALIVNPGMAKWGDARGQNLDQRLDIIPALVFVESTAEMVSLADADREPDFDMDPEYEQKVKIKLEHA